MKVVTSEEAQAQFLELLDEVERGEEVMITRNGGPIALLVPQGQAAENQADGGDDGPKASTT